MLSLCAKEAKLSWRYPTRDTLRRVPRFYSRAPRSPGKRDTLEPPTSDRWNYNTTPLFDVGDRSLDEHMNYKFVTANELETATIPPRRVKMLVRDFIEDSLYNPNYGYFPKQATIFDTQETVFDFPSLRDSAEFQVDVGRKYAAYGADDHQGPGRQLWHTPTELFKVFFSFCFVFLIGLDF